MSLARSLTLAALAATALIVGCAMPAGRTTARTEPDGCAEFGPAESPRRDHGQEPADTPEPSSLVKPREESTLLGRVWQDHRNYYSLRNLGRVGVGVAAGAVIANTDTDEKLNDAFQENVRGADTDEWSEYLRVHKDLGDGLYLLPVYGGAMAAAALLDESECAGSFGEWGERSLRATLVGGPPMLLAQRVTGGSRPGERGDASHWRPLSDENGVSGHTFMGAVPFLTAAEMTDNLFAKSAFYAASTLVGLSRINDEAHYPSQAFLGWWMAYAASRTVDATQDGRDESGWRIVPLEPGTGDGAGVEWTW